jgi:hypothetical protein
MNYIVKYASKQERSGNTLQQVIKTIINKADVTDNAGSAFRSSIIRPLAIVTSGKVKRRAFCFPATTVNHSSITSTFLWT